eukprot:COSAG03_NODE_15105_length_441_cov_0.596491_1_plen_72_part_10
MVAQLEPQLPCSVLTLLFRHKRKHRKQQAWRPDRGHRLQARGHPLWLQSSMLSLACRYARHIHPINTSLLAS